MTMLPCDSVPCWTPDWEEIQGKAHMYKTAMLRSTGEYVAIVRVIKYADGLELIEPAFEVRTTGNPPFTVNTDDLCNFCL